MNKNRNYKGTSGLTLLMFVALAFFVFWFTNRVQVRENTISYQSFVKAVEKDQVTDVSISQNKEVPTGVLTISMDGDDTIYTVNVSDVKEAEKVLEDAKIDYELENVPQETWFSQTLAPTLIMLLGVALLFMLMNRQGGGANAKAMSFGKSRARMSTDQDKRVTFENVAGLKEEKEQLEEIVDFLKAPQKYI